VKFTQKGVKFFRLRLTSRKRKNVPAWGMLKIRRLTNSGKAAMKPRLAKQRNRALTLVEVLVVLVIIAGFILLTIPATSSRHTRSTRIACVSNLKQIGIACRLWEGDNHDKYPMAVSVTNGGAMELMARGNVTAGFLVMSNELSTPDILWCPADTLRVRAASFPTLNNSNLSYFAGLDVTNETNPQRLLSGDDNFCFGVGPVKSGLLALSTNSSIAWATGRHVAYNSHFWTSARDRFVGNIGLADGSVQQVTTDGLQQALQHTGVATNRLAVP
jgi:competence protein ComGC